MKRAVISGLGIISSCGYNHREFWENIEKGTCGIDEITLFDTTGYRTHIGGQVKNFNPEQYFSRRALRRMSRCDQLGLVAYHEALRDSGLAIKEENPARLGIFLGAGAGGMISAELYRRRHILRPEKPPRPSLLVSFESSVLTDLIGAESGCTGPRSTVVTACSSSATAIGYGLDAIRSGDVDIVIAGGSESLCELTFGGFNSLRSVDVEPCRPFDKSRKGLSLGEGAGILIIEELDHALTRNATIYGELLGYALSSDAYHMTAPEPTATGAGNVMAWAIEDAGLSPDDIGYVSAHGTATRHNDVMEAKALYAVFGDRAAQLPISSMKSMIGHCLGAAGAVEGVALALTISTGLLPPTIHYETPDPDCPLDVVPNVSRQGDVRYGLSNSFAFGGNNTALVIGAYNE